MRFLAVLLACFVFPCVKASVFLPHTIQTRIGSPSLGSHQHRLAQKSRRQLRLSRQKSYAMAIPGYGVAEQVFVGGFANFLSIYNLVITARILLSWFPQAQGIAVLQPVYAITDPFLNLFRGVIPPIFGLDFSPIAAFFLLNLLSNATAAVGCEIPPNYHDKKKKHIYQQVPSFLLGNKKPAFEVSLN